MKPGKKVNLITITLLFCIGIFVVMIQKQQDPLLVVSFLSVGQGDAIFVEAPNGTQVLIDAGPDGATVRELAKVMPFWDRTIDMIIPTHADKDHIGGFPEVLKRFHVKGLYDMKSESSTEIFEAFDFYKEQEDMATAYSKAGDTIVIDATSGVYMRVLFPGDLSENIERNDTSTVLQLVYGEKEFMLTGDAGLMVEEYLVHQYDNFLKSDVLKAGHHGSRTSTGELFLEKVRPEYVVISAGENNSYGHPHEEVVLNIQKSGAQMLQTKDGIIQFKTNGVDMWVEQK